MSELTKHLPLESYEGAILSALGKGLTLADAHHDLSPAEGEAVIAEITRRVNLHEELVEALRRARMVLRTYDPTYADDVSAVLAKVDAAKEAR